MYKVVMEHLRALETYDLRMDDENQEILMNKNIDVMKSNKCNQCDFTCSHASNLRGHLIIHSGEKSYKCNQCDYASCWVGDLRKHLKRHSGEKSNKCKK